MLILSLAFAGLGVMANRTSQRLEIDERQPSLDWRVSENESKQRVITSPLVSLQRRLLKQSDNEQFSVTSRDADGGNGSSYWRLTALDDFNGESWQSTGEFRKLNSGGTIRSAVPDGSTILTQRFQIGELGTESLPAAFVPLGYRGDIEGVSYAGSTETILARRSLSPGATYEITSATPVNLDLRDLERYDTHPVADDTDVLLPVTFPDRVRRLAVEITKDQPTTVGKARALQDFFRTQFEYSLDVPAGSSEPALERFLFTDRRGYCEQFSGAFAAMARSLGIPARVAVGFTPGRFDPTDGRFHVTGKNAHAWPEIRLGDGTWFPFEPTPGRGFPGLAQTTGVQAQDLSEDSSPTPATTVVAAVPTTPTTTTPPPPATPVTAPKTSTGWRVAVALLLVVAAGVAAVLLLRRRRVDDIDEIMPTPARVRERTGAEIRIEHAWKQATTRVGAQPERTSTELTVASPLSEEHPELPELVTLIQRARYASQSPAEVTDVEAVRAEELSSSITLRTSTLEAPRKTGSERTTPSAPRPPDRPR